MIKNRNFDVIYCKRLQMSKMNTWKIYLASTFDKKKKKT